MARKFWPNTPKQPRTKPVRIDKRTGKLSSKTAGTVFRYAVVTAEERQKYEALRNGKKTLEKMWPGKDGMKPIKYRSKRSGRSLTGYLYGDSGKEVSLNNFMGAAPDSTIFISKDLTFMEFVCPGFAPWPFDTRDSTWNGSEWVGVTPKGEWITTPVTFWNNETDTWNLNAFNHYFFGPGRDIIYSGKNEDGTPFVGKGNNAPLNKNFKPAPKYFATPEDVNRILKRDTDPLHTKGWTIREQGTSYNTQTTGRLDDMGSFKLSLAVSLEAPPHRVPFNFKFDSYQYESLNWEVGSTVDLDFSRSDKLYVSAQGVRKGYLDSDIKEFCFEQKGAKAIHWKKRTICK